jgi:maltose alpha-D-glucosyltransferase / alpha-amylase
MARRDQWYENAIIYCLDVETYADSDGDGIGDFPGLTGRLDYLAGLGVTCIWLMPFYPSPGCDDGYDVSDYTAVDPRYGSIADFAEFVAEARERGLRVIVDLTPNHSSDQHSWFQMAREDPSSKYYDYYIWRKDDPGDTSDQVVFPGEQKGIWTKDEKVGEWYLHHFHEFQPDLNFSNTEVREEFRKIMGLWLQLGVSGFRIDAAPFLINLEGVDVGIAGMDKAHQYLEEMQELVTVRKGNAILLGEVDEGLSTIADYFGGGNQLHALFNFPMNRYAFLGLAQQSADSINFGLGQLPSIPGAGQWVNFLRHHDELNLSRMTMEQRQQVFDAFGPEPEMQVYGRGLRRRLAPMLDGDPARLRMAYSMLFSLPGAPMIFYGEEIGMGEQPKLDGRMAVRAPMQWTSYGHGGFSSAPPEKLVRPILSEGDFGYEQVSVAASRSDRDSLLNWMSTLIRARRECGEIGYGDWSLVETGCEAIFAIRFDNAGSAVVAATNLSPERQSIALDLPPDDLPRATDLLCDRPYKALADTDGKMRIEGYGFRWMRLDGVY